jgi:hypothetical protein
MFLIYFESQQQQVQQENKRRNKRKSLQQSILSFSLADFCFCRLSTFTLWETVWVGDGKDSIASLYTLVYIGAIAAAVGQRVLDIFCAVLLLFVG